MTPISIRTLPALLLFIFVDCHAADTPPAKTAAIVRFDTCEKPVWPRESLRNEETGTVILEFLIDDEGTVLDAVTRSSSGAPLLDEAALSGIRRCKFKPATINGVATGKWQKLQYVWTLESEERTKLLLEDATRYRTAALAGDLKALYQLAHIFKDGNGVKQDIPRYIKLLQAAAHGEYSEAEFDMAVVYEYGQGVAKDKGQAITWYQKAANHDHTNAQLKLAAIYEAGDGLTADLSQAQAWYQRAAEQGNHDAQNALGKLLEASGKEVQAAAWYRKAAQAGHMDACYHLGKLYLQGRGVDKDVEAAAQWLTKAASERQVQAEATLANLYFAGIGVPQDDAQGFKYLRRAAVAGNIMAMRQLGLMLSQGLHAAADPKEGAIWLSKASRLGLPANDTDAVNFNAWQFK